MASLAAIKAIRTDPMLGFDIQTQLMKILAPSDQGGWITLFGILVFAIVIGLFTAAVAAARSGNITEE
jgi:hypothetical protein